MRYSGEGRECPFEWNKKPLVLPHKRLKRSGSGITIPV
ncbi:hypothetical protein CHCC14821_2731 [Bacillus paralicheniformis]|nr:hypothetical protein CHCC14821_2731 [Bacillus paralicheniformis]